MIPGKIVMSETSEIQFFTAVTENDQNDVLKFLILHFVDHPLFILAPVPVEDLKIFWNRLVQVNLIIIARLDTEIVGCYTGSVTTWKQLNQVNAQVARRISINTVHDPKLSHF